MHLRRMNILFMLGSCCYIHVRSIWIYCYLDIVDDFGDFLEYIFITINCFSADMKTESEKCMSSAA